MWFLLSVHMNIIILAKNGVLYMLPLPTPQKIKGNFLERKTKRMWRRREQITKPCHKCIQMCCMSTEAELYTDKEGTWELVQQAVKCFQKLKTQWHGMFQWRGDQNLLRAVWTVGSHSNREQATTTHMNRGPWHLICVEMIKSLALEIRTLLHSFPFLSSSRRTDCKYGCQRIF